MHACKQNGFQYKSQVPKLHMLAQIVLIYMKVKSVPFEILLNVHSFLMLCFNGLVLR